MPAGGQTTDESVITRWHKAKGDFVRRGDILFEIETDKAALEVESYCDGYLLAVLHMEGESVSAGTEVAYIGESGEVAKDAESIKEIKDDDELSPIADPDKAPASVPSKQGMRKLSSPLAKKTALEAGIALEEIAVKNGRVVKKKDVLDYLSDSRKPEVSEGFELIPSSPMRRTIAGRMCTSSSTAPHYTVSIEVDMTDCILLRNKLNTHLDGRIKISFNDIIAICVAKSIGKYPMINASYEGDQIRIYQDVNIGFAIEVEDGLVVAVVKQANKKKLSEIARENAENVRCARNDKLTADQQTGGTITISNLGMYGVEWFTAIINPPEGCVLAIARIAEKAVSIDGEIVSRMQMSITASFDHRLIDGALGARFLSELKILLETPEILFM